MSGDRDLDSEISADPLLVSLYLHIEKKEPVEIFYAKANKPYEKRLITPSRIYARDGAIYVDAYCHLRSALRVFRADRIKIEGIDEFSTSKVNSNSKSFAQRTKPTKKKEPATDIQSDHLGNAYSSKKHVGSDQYSGKNKMQTSQNEESINPSTNGGFVKALCSYYAEFLETDFKKERLPKRRTEYKNSYAFDVLIMVASRSLLLEKIAAKTNLTRFLNRLGNLSSTLICFLVFYGPEDSSKL